MAPRTERLGHTRSLFLPLETARVCLDCDLLTDSLVCPLCARERTVPISWWLRPLDGARLPTGLVTYLGAGEPRGLSTDPVPDLTGSRSVIVVEGAHPEVYERLRRSLKPEAPFDLVYERRRRDRRRAGGTNGVERRRGDRRRRRPTAVVYDRSPVVRATGGGPESPGSAWLGS